MFDSTIPHNAITSREMYGVDTKMSSRCLFYNCHKWHWRSIKPCTIMNILYCAIEKLFVHVVFKETDVLHLLCQKCKNTSKPSMYQVGTRYVLLCVNINYQYSMYPQQMNLWHCTFINSFWPSYTECLHRSWSTLAGFSGWHYTITLTLVAYH